jgi:hypothetical protein
MGAKKKTIIAMFDNGGLIDGDYINPENPIDIRGTRQPLSNILLPRNTPNIPAGTAANSAKTGGNKYSGASDTIGALAPVAIGAIDAIDTGAHTGGRTTIGGQAGKGAISGLQMGANPALMAATGGLSAPIGAVVGGIYGLIKGKAEQKKMLREQEDQAGRLQRHYEDNTLQTNIDLNGNRFEDGGMVSPEAGGENTSMQPSVEKMINVERGELMVDPMSMNVVQEFLNPNRFSKHSKNQFMEPNGNFVSVPKDHIIIPKKLAGRYKTGDVLTRKSIVMQLLSDQANDPNFNTPDKPVAGTEKFELGGGTGPVDNLPVKRKFKIPQDLIDDTFVGPQNMTVGTNSMGRSFVNQIKVTPSKPVPFVAPTIVNNTEDNTAGDTPQEGTAPAAGRVGRFSKVNTGSAARTLLQTLPIVSQMATNGRGDPFLGENPNVQYNTAISYAHELPEDISVAGNLAANDRSFLTASKAIDNNDTPAARAEKGALLAEKFAGDNSVYANKEAVGVQLKSTKLQALLGLTTAQGADWQRDRGSLMTELRMDAAARENNSNAAIANLSENAQLAQNDTERVKALNAITHSVNIDPFAKDIMKEDPNFISFIYDYMTSGKGDYVSAKNEYIARRNSKDKTTIYDKTVTDKKGNAVTTKGTKKEINN